MKQFEEIAPIALHFCVDYIHEEIKVPTTCHPESNMYVLTPKLMAQIIKHRRNMRAQIPLSENTFYSWVLRYLESLGKMKSLYNKNGFFTIKRGNNGGFIIRQFGGRKKW